MSTDSDKGVKTRPLETNLKDISPVSFNIEHEKLKLETERLQIERERLSSEREKLEHQAAGINDPGDLSFGITAICIVAAVCLILGGITGFTSGLDLGRRHTPQPRKLLVSRQFISMMKNVRGYRTPVITDFKDTPWIPPRHRTYRESLIIIK